MSAAAAEIERLRTALQPFAALSEYYEPREPSDESACPWGDGLPYIADLHRAKDAIERSMLEEYNPLTPHETTI